MPVEGPLDITALRVKGMKRKAGSYINEISFPQKAPVNKGLAKI